jgi:hypothetical protein
MSLDGELILNRQNDRKKNIDPAALAFDVDGVFADTMRLFLDIAHSEFRIDGIKYEDITCYNLEECIPMDPKIIDAIIVKILDGDFRIPLKPMDSAPEVITRIAERYGPVLFVTARSNPDPVRKWMEQILPLSSRSVEIVATGTYDKKAEVLIEKNISYFVEDRLETCFSLKEAGVTPILYRQPWNREPHPFREVGSWQEIESLIMG